MGGDIINIPAAAAGGGCSCIAADHRHQINRAVEVVKFNKEQPWEACRMSSKPIPSAPAGHVVVRVLCRSVNPSDVACLMGRYIQWQPSSFPAVAGLEGMGIIHQVGDGVTGVDVGQRVYPFCEETHESGQGLWQDYIVVPVGSVVPIPPSIPDDMAAQFYVNPWSVVGMISVLGVPKGDYLIQTAATSVLGRMLIQYAHHQGIKTINIVRSGDQVSELKALGADEVINSSEEDVLQRVNVITGGKLAHSAVDAVGGKTTDLVVKCTRNKGKILVYGAVGGVPRVEVRILDLIFREITLQGFWLASWVQTLSPLEFVEISNHVFTLLEKKMVIPLVGPKFQLHQFEDAIKKSLEPGRGGKVLLVS